VKTGALTSKFAVAYAVPVSYKSSPEYDNDITFVLNTDDTDIADKKKDFTSRKEFWSVKQVSAFQPATDKDGDPDSEHASGTTQGITGSVGSAFSRPTGSLIYLETIRDNAAVGNYSSEKLERLSVVHESGHQFNLEHEDGYNGTPTDNSDDYLMTDKTGSNGTFPNERFSPISIDKIRSIDYPHK
jgi:hypothetical protein